MAAARPPPTRFHAVHGVNVRVDASGTRATRVESFAHGLCFSHRPLEPGQIFLVEIEEKEPGWCGHLRVGLTAHDPRSLAPVPEHALPDLVDLGDSWVFAITRNHNRVTEAPAGGRALLSGPHLFIGPVRIPRDKLVGRSRPGRYSHILDELYKTNVLPATARKSRIGVLFAPQPDGTADMHMVINGEDMGPSARGLPGSRPLYAVIDLFASTKSVRIIQVEYGLPSLQTLCRTAVQKHITHRLAIEELNLPPLLKNLCNSERPDFISAISTCESLAHSSDLSGFLIKNGKDRAAGGESTGGSSSESKEAPGSRPSPFAHVPREAPPSASLPCPAGLLRRKLQAKQMTPLQGGATRLPQVPSLPQSCPAPGALRQGSTDPWEPPWRLPLQNGALEYPLEHPADRWLYLSPGAPQPLQQQQQPASPSGDFALAQWGFVPSSGVVVMSAKLSRDRDAQPRLAWPPNICILTLAMMIAGIPTVPVPGVREEDMIHAAQRFMAENLEAGEGPAEGAPSRRWAALQRLGSSCKRDRQRRRAAHRSLLPLFLAQLEK